MDLTLAELAGILDPTLTVRQVSALVVLAGVESGGFRHTGRSGRPAPVYDADAVIAAHAEEVTRSAGQFADTDWISAALIARKVITWDSAVGAIWWQDGTRAERLGGGNYGWVHVGKIPVPAHRVIWIAGDGPIPPCMQVNHINRLRWDNRRANLELTSFGNNIRHAHGKPYLTYHDAIRQLDELPPQPDTIDPFGGRLAGGRVIAGIKSRRPGH